LEQNQKDESTVEGEPSSLRSNIPESDPGDINIPPDSANDITALNENTGLISKTNPAMEVHHHGHVHHKNKWKEYIFQFFMLFLAVFCGFLAEYELEHRIEKERAEEYAASLVTDLEKDIASIKAQIEFREKIYRNADSLMGILRDGTFTKNTDQCARNIVGIGRLNRLRAFKGTIDQLKASGSLRYFKNKQLTTSLINYYNRLNEVDTRIQYIFDYLAKNLNPFTISHYDSRYDDSRFRSTRNVAPFRNMGEEEQIQLYNISSSLYGNNFQLANTVLPNAMKEAEQLIELIKHEYKLEGEKG
jgi:hypothetical protein